MTNAYDLDDATVVADDGRVILDRLTLRGLPGSSTFLVGHVGGGKTTVLRLLAAMTAPTSGEVRVFGKDVTALDYDALREHRIRTGYVFESTGLIGNLTIGENIALPLGYQEEERIGAARVRQKLGELATELGIAPHLDERSFKANASVQKRALVARALVLEPTLLLCDEPQVGLTLREAHRVSAAIERRRKARGMTVIYADHDGYFEPFVSDRALYLDHGRLVDRPSVGPSLRASQTVTPAFDGERNSITLDEIYRNDS